jgi:TolB-like protein
VDSVSRIGTQRESRHRNGSGGAVRQRKCGLLAFVGELRRRKVCRALTMYAVALWLVSQVVDLAYQQLGMPEWTLRFVIVVGLVGLPIALFLSWLMDLTPNGMVLESRADEGQIGPGTQASGGKAGRIVDCCLVLAAMAITANLAYGTVNSPAAALTPHYERIAVTTFRVGPGDAAPALSESLTTELQHELATHVQFKVIASQEPFEAMNCLTLIGSVSTDTDYARITLALIDNESKEVVWSDAIQRDRTDTVTTTSDLARDIVSVLQQSTDRLPRQEAHDGS